MKSKQISFNDLYWLAKPGIVYGNCFSALAGFLFASADFINFKLLLATIVGIGLVIASACVFNNYLDRNIDKLMSRTKTRALASQSVPTSLAIIYGIVLGLAGITVLILFTNWITVLLGAIGLIDYVFFYSPSKRLTPHSTLIGTIAGSTPIAAGYTSASGHFDKAALMLFIIMLTWQMPHFYSIAIRRLKEYKDARLPVLPVKKGIYNTQIQMLTYIASFIAVNVIFTLLGYSSVIYAIVVSGLGLYWLYLGLRGIGTKDSTAWSKKMFDYSLIVMLGFSFMLMIDHLLV